jgi:hypothetical protein
MQVLRKGRDAVQGANRCLYLSTDVSVSFAATTWSVLGLGIIKIFSRGALTSQTQPFPSPFFPSPSLLLFPPSHPPELFPVFINGGWGVT